jgi:hypothetical protein
MGETPGDEAERELMNKRRRTLKPGGFATRSARALTREVPAIEEVVEPSLAIEDAPPPDPIQVDFDRTKLSPEVLEMLKHLRPTRTQKGAANELRLLRTLAKPDEAAFHLEVFERFPNRMIKALSRQQNVADRVRELVNAVRSGEINVDEARTPTPIRMDSSGDELLVPVDKEFREMTAQVAKMKRSYNTLVESETSRKRASSLNETQIDRVRKLKSEAAKVHKNLPEESKAASEAAYAKFVEVSDKYLQDLRKGMAPIRVTQDEQELLARPRGKSSKASSSKASSSKG